jgi:CBS domain-containing protein
MRDHGVGSLAVVDGQRLVGMITDRDIALAVLCEQIDPETTPVREVMKTNPVSILLTTTSSQAARKMRQAKVRRLPAVSPSMQVAGMVTHDDLVSRLSKRLCRIGETIQQQLVQSGHGPTPGAK